MNPLSPDVQAGVKPAAEYIEVIRRFCIPVALAAAVGFGYLAFVSPSSPGISILDIAFVTSVVAFLMLLVSTLGEQLKRTSDRERAEAERNSDT